MLLPRILGENLAAVSCRHFIFVQRLGRFYSAGQAGYLYPISWTFNDQCKNIVFFRILRKCAQLFFGQQKTRRKAGKNTNIFLD